MQITELDVRRALATAINCRAEPEVLLGGSRIVIFYDLTLADAFENMVDGNSLAAMSRKLGVGTFWIGVKQGRVILWASLIEADRAAVAS